MPEQNNEGQNDDFFTSKNRAGSDGAAEEEQNPGAQRPEGAKYKANKEDAESTGSHQEGSQNKQNRNSGMQPGSLDQ